MTAPVPPPLCVTDDATFWAWRRWPEFARWPDRENTLVIVPLAGMADWGLGHALDLEETVLLHVLRAVAQSRPPALALVMTPPLRFVLGPDPGCAFAVDPSVAHAWVAEVLGSIAASGFRRVLLYNSSPWNEEFIAVVARDNRIALGLQIFRISLSGLGLDLHPGRSPAPVRRKMQTLVTALKGCEPEAVEGEEWGGDTARGWGDECVRRLPGPAVSLATAKTEGERILSDAAKRLLALLMEIRARPALTNQGVIPTAQP